MGSIGAQLARRSLPSPDVVDDAEHSDRLVSRPDSASSAK